MDVASSHILSTALFLLCAVSQSVHCQQVYLNDTVYDCSNNPSIPKGYLCNGLQKSCRSFLSLRSKPPYDTPLSIAYLLGSEASIISSINNVSDNDKIPTNKSVVVPISCSCSGNIYQHNTPYTVRLADTYYQLTKRYYQGLTTCQSLMGQNYYAAVNIPVAAQLSVPLLCACPTAEQAADGVTSLLAYTAADGGERVDSVAKAFGVDESAVANANKLPLNSIIAAFTPILVPLKGKTCKQDPNSFFCTCSSSSAAADASSVDLYCKDSDDQKFPVKLVASLGAGIGAGLLCLFLLGYKLYQCLKQKRRNILKQKLFKQNGGFLLQEKISSYGNGEKAKLFTAEELRRATDNYNQSRFVGQGGYGVVYKGMLPDGTIVAVKKSKQIDRSQIETFINEVVILSQINHRNIVKLLGCCLETEAPLLVYEFIPNGTLSHHIHTQRHELSLSWDCRLQIACEVAGAVAYMHFAASMPIFHRDIKPSNILLDDKFRAKVSDFGTSRSVPHDKTHLTTAVQGTFGYIDPEYFQSSQFTDKSDVYSFGVVLVELFTGKKPISFLEEDEGQNLIAEFISSMKEDKLFKILDDRVVNEASIDDVVAVANLAMRCLRLNGKKRPTMKEVSVELEALRKAQSTVQINQDSELPIDLTSVRHTSSQAVQDSTEESILLSLQESTSISDYRFVTD